MNVYLMANRFQNPSMLQRRKSMKILENQIILKFSQTTKMMLSIHQKLPAASNR